MGGVRGTRSPIARRHVLQQACPPGVQQADGRRQGVHGCLESGPGQVVPDEPHGQVTVGAQGPFILFDLPAKPGHQRAAVTDPDHQRSALEEVDPERSGGGFGRGQHHVGHLVAPESAVSRHAEFAGDQDHVETGVPPCPGGHATRKQQVLVRTTRCGQDARVPWQSGPVTDHSNSHAPRSSCPDECNVPTVRTRPVPSHGPCRLALQRDGQAAAITGIRYAHL